MFKKSWWIITSLLVVASMLLAACGPTAVPTTEVEPAGETEAPAEETEAPAEETEAPAGPEISPEFKNEDTYVVVTGAGEPETLDPAWTYETAGSAVEANVYEGLVWFNREKYGEFVPALATEWTTSEDGLTWTFNIRDGVTFHEGGTLEPHDIAYTVHRAMLQGRLDGPQWMIYEGIFGSDMAMASSKDLAAALIGKETFEELTPADLVQVCETIKSSVVADDEAGTVTYNLTQPMPWFLSLAASNFLGDVLDKEWMIENGDWDDDCATWQDWADPSAEETLLFNKANGTGPYKLDHWTPGEEIVLTANENYWRTEPMWEGGPSGVASIKRVVIKNIDEWGTRQAMFEAGDADYIYVPAQYRPQLEPFYKTICYPDGTCEEGNANGYIQAYRDQPEVAMTPAQFNWQINVEGGNPYVGSGAIDGNGITPDFFSDIHIRKAFNYCFDFDTMIADALNGEGMQAQGPIIAGMMGYREGEAPLYSYDMAKCEEEFKLADLDKDGVPAGEDEDDVWNKGFYMQIAYNTGNDTRRLASEILKAGIETVNPKFNIAVVGMPWPVMLNSRTAGKLPVYVGGWLEDFHDPHNWVQPFLYSHGTYGRVINITPDVAAEFDELIIKGATLSDPEERRAIYEEIQLKAQEEAVVIWMYQPIGRSHLQEWIKGFYFNPAYFQAEYTWIYALSKEMP